MLILRITIIGLFCVCHVSCQNTVDDWVMKAVKQPQGECRVDDGRYGNCVKKSQCNMPPIPSPVFGDRIVICQSTQVCCPEEYIKNEEKPKPRKRPRPALCGVSNPGASFRSLSDEGYSEFSEFPWMVALLRSRKRTEWSSADLIGGGALIHRSVVITATHKILQYYHTPRKIKCRAGEWNTTGNYELLPHQDRNVKKFVAHDDYVAINRQYDVSLVILSEPFDLTSNIDIACLGKVLPAPGTQCFGMGWGQDVSNSNQYAQKLKKIRLPFVDAEKCQSDLRKTALGAAFELHPTLMCAGGGEGVDLCAGDGGSPLVCPIDSMGLETTRYAVFGMAAYGMACGVKNVPGVYVNVPSVQSWVVEQMELQNLESSQFLYH